MFKKMVLVGILLAVVLVLSGCGTYDSSFKSNENYFSYGGFYVPKVDGPNSECGKDGFKTVGNLCFAVGNENRCNQLPVSSGLKNVLWLPRNVPKYSANFCVLICSLELGSCGDKASCYQLSDKSMNICSPSCTSDADCLPGLTSCKEVLGPKFKLCVPNDDLSKSPQIKPIPLPPPLPQQVCGNGKVEGNEKCDLPDLSGKTCTDLGYSGGKLWCDDGCNFDTQQCTTVCGNNKVEPGEDCDDGNKVDKDGCSSMCKKEVQQQPPQDIPLQELNKGLAVRLASFLDKQLLCRQEQLLCEQNKQQNCQKNCRLTALAEIVNEIKKWLADPNNK